MIFASTKDNAWRAGFFSVMPKVVTSSHQGGGIDVPSDDDFFGEGHVGEGGFELGKEGADFIGKEKELETILAVGFCQRAGAGIVDDGAVGEGFFKFGGEVLQGELGEGGLFAS